MKNIISLLCILVLSLGLVSAEWSATISDYKNQYNSEYSDIIIDKNLNFEVTRNGYEVLASWDEYLWDDFKYYKLVKAYTHDNPVYPDDKTIFVGMKSTQNQNTFKDWSNQVANIRVCVITDENDRICSDVKQLEAFSKNIDDYKKEEPQMCIQVIQPAYNPLTWECKEFSTPCNVTKGWKKVDSCNDKIVISTQERFNDKKENVAEKLENPSHQVLDRVMKQRSDEVIEKLIKNIDAQDITNESKVEKVEKMVSKLNALENKMKTQQAKLLINYLVQELTIKAEMFDKQDDIESIFEALSE